MRLQKGKKGISKSRLVPETCASNQEDDSESAINADGVDGDVQGNARSRQPTQSTCRGCKYPNYGLHAFIPRLEVNCLQCYFPLDDIRFIQSSDSLSSSTLNDIL